MVYTEEDYLMISGIQHFIFCRRQWALIHIEQQWKDNYLTAEGEVMHQNAHKDDFMEKRPGILITRGLRVASSALGMTGQCDVVEFRDNPEGVPIYGHRGLWDVIPIEYKRGKDKEDISDISQLCCEAMCLEEMLGCEISYGYLYYHKIRRRRKVELDQGLRDGVRKITEEMHEYFRRGYTPKVKPSKKCQSCSMKELCLPRLCRNISAKEYLKRILDGEDIE